MRVFITGATGFLGSYAVDAFIAAGHDVAVLARPGTDPWRIAGQLDALTMISGSLDNAPAFADDLAAFRPDTVLNIAWIGVGGSAHDDPAQVENIGYIQSLMDISARAGVKHWIGLGSQAEYGTHDNAITEDTPPEPATAYGKTKLQAMENTCNFCATHDMRFVWARVFACYGPRDKELWLIPSVIKTLLQGREPELTDGQQRWDYLYVADAAAALLTLAETPGATGVFNLGSGEAIPVRTIVEHIRDQIDPTLPLGFGKRAMPDRQIMHLEADIARLQSATGWAPSMPIADGLAETVAWYRGLKA